MGNKKVLVIEDEKSLADIMVNMLQVFGFSGEIAPTGHDALDRMSEESFDHIILDLSLPDITGDKLYRKICEKYPEFKGRIVFTSGYEAPDEIEEILDTDGGLFLPKPFSVDKFQEILNKLS